MELATQNVLIRHLLSARHQAFQVAGGRSGPETFRHCFLVACSIGDYNFESSGEAVAVWRPWLLLA